MCLMAMAMLIVPSRRLLNFIIIHAIVVVAMVLVVHLMFSMTMSILMLLMRSHVDVEDFTANVTMHFTTTRIGP